MSQSAKNRPDASETDDLHATVGGEVAAPVLDQTLALPPSLPPAPSEDGDTCHIPVEPDDHPTQAGSNNVPPPPQPALDQTLNLDDHAPPSLSRPLDQTEQLSEPGATHPVSVIEQTLNDASLPSHGVSYSAAGPTRPLSPPQRYDTVPLASGSFKIPETCGGELSDDGVTSPIATVPSSVQQGGVRLPTVPGYVLQSELGRGGMGVVYQARHTRLNRVVALKMIRSGAQAGSEDLRRFRSEAEAVAKLTHPNIVQIYEIGETDGLPWFSLEFIDGGSLHQKLRKDTALPARVAAELVETLARAMHYAHERGIVHRDLKPANIMLADCGLRIADCSEESAIRNLQSAIPKITDFGLAKHLEKDTGHTREGSILGTPSYMAPEQAEGKNSLIGPPADIYALGAILYDLLASRPPFRGETVVDTLQQVINTEPLPPTQLQPGLPRDLETVCLKCLQKDPQKRYLSAGALADDLRRFLDGEPILARATPWWEKAVKWAKRRPAAAALLLFALLTVVGVVSGSAWIASEKSERAAEESRLRGIAEENEEKERRERERADRLAEKEAAARQRADRRAFDAMTAVERLLTTADEKLEHLPQLQEVREQLLTDAARFLRRFHRENKDDPALREQLAFGQKRLGEVLAKLGEQTEAREAYRESFELFDGLARAQPQRIEYRRNAGILAEQLGTQLELNEEHGEAGKLYRRAIDDLTQARAVYPDDKGRAGLLAGLIASPAQPWGQPWNGLWNTVSAFTWESETERVLESLGAVYLARGNQHQRRNETSLALQDMTKARELFEELARFHPNEPRYRWRRGVAHNSLGVNLRPTSLQKAVDEFTLAVDLLTPLVPERGGVALYRAELASASLNRGTVLYPASLNPGGEQLRQQAELDLVAAATHFASLAADYSRNVEYQQELVRARSNLASFYRDSKQPAAALKTWRAALAALDGLPPRIRDRFEVRHQRALFHDEIAKAQLAQPMPRYQEAAEAWDVAIKALDALVKERPEKRELWQTLTTPHFNRCLALRKQGLVAEAVESYRAYIAALEARNRQFKEQPRDRAELAITLFQWAGLQRERTLTQQADATLKRAVEIQRKVIVDEPKFTLHRQNLCVYLTALGDHGGVLVAVKEWDEQLTGAEAELHEAAWSLAYFVAVGKPEAKKHEELGREAARLLKKAVGHGFKDGKLLERPEWGPLRTHPDVKAAATLLK